MKLLGKYETERATKYKALLLDYSIEAKVDFDPENLPSAMATGLSRGVFAEGIALMGVYVPEESFDKAVGIINDYEKKQIMNLKENNKKFNFVIPQILITVGIILLILIFFIKK